MGIISIIQMVPSSFWRFSLIGIGGLFVDLVVLYSFILGLNLSPMEAKLFSFLAAVSFTWWLNRSYTFSQSHKKLLYEWSVFVTTNAFGGLINFLVYTFFVAKWSFVWMPALATMIGSLVGLIFNYLGSKNFVFKQSNLSLSVYSSMAMTVFCLAILLAPAIWNGFPLVFFDSGGYVFSSLRLLPDPGRSIFYGFFIWISSLDWLFIWGPVLVQAMLILWSLRLLLKSHDLPIDSLSVIIICSVLGLLTGISWYTSQLMPDILIPSTILAFWLLGFRWEKLCKFERVGLSISASLGLLSHMSCLALAIGLLIISMLAFAILRHRDTSLQVSLLAPNLVVIVCLITMPLTHLALLGKATFTPGGNIFLFGRMVQDGIAQRWLGDHCPVKGIKLCELQDRIPNTGDEFLWSSNSPLWSDLGGWDGADFELGALVNECVKTYPDIWLRTGFQATLQQMVMVATGEGILAYHWHNRWVFSELLTSGIAKRFNEARQQQESIPHYIFDRLNEIHVSIAYISLLTLPLIIIWSYFKKRHELAGLALFISISLIGNAFICGALSNPHDRYQSRVIWLATLVSIMAVLDKRRPNGLKLE